MLVATASLLASPAQAADPVLYDEGFSTPVAAGQVGAELPSVWTIDRAGSAGAYADENLSVADGSLRITLRGTDAGGDGHAGGYVVFGQRGSGYSPGTRFEYDFKVVGNGHGWGANFMLWPVDDKWSEGEINFVEGNLDLHMHLYHHYLSCRADGYCGNYAIVDSKRWGNDRHSVRIDWRPDSITYYLDGKKIKKVTGEVPQTPHRLTLQVSQNEGTPHGTTQLRVYGVKISKLS